LPSFRSTTVFSLNTHNTIAATNSEIKLPINTLYEREGLVINSEGRIQKTFKSIKNTLRIKRTQQK